MPELSSLPPLIREPSLGCTLYRQSENSTNSGEARCLPEFIACPSTQHPLCYVYRQPLTPSIFSSSVAAPRHEMMILQASLRRRGGEVEV